MRVFQVIYRDARGYRETLPEDPDRAHVERDHSWFVSELLREGAEVVSDGKPKHQHPARPVHRRTVLRFPDVTVTVSTAEVGNY